MVLDTLLLFNFVLFLGLIQITRLPFENVMPVTNKILSLILTACSALLVLRATASIYIISMTHRWGEIERISGFAFPFDLTFFQPMIFPSQMLKMSFLFLLFFLTAFARTGAGKEPVAFLNLYNTIPDVFQASSHSALPIAVSVGDESLYEVSSSVLMAETWLRSNVLARYPATKITTIVVGDTVLCNRGQEHKLHLVLPSLNNLYRSLTRWGLEKEIKVSAAFSSNCLMLPYSASYRDDLTEKVIKPLLEFLQSTNSTYSINPYPKSSSLSDQPESLASYHSGSMGKLGFVEFKNINVLVPSPKEKKSMGRKLSFMDEPIPEMAQSPLHSSVGYPVPANVAQSPHPPIAQIASPPSLPFAFAPEKPPPPLGLTLPPCKAPPNSAPEPETAGIQKLWCVAKPSIPAETLQVAMDYACGEGGAACEEIQPNGNCYHPDTVVAHASYAFNSYWQKNKRNGGGCSFGGTAMLINTDPSSPHCRFVLS